LTLAHDDGRVGAGRALAIAFGTSSTAAALPAAMEAARGLGCAPAVVDFVLPLGTTGAALCHVACAKLL
jgi:Na+/H+-dicarboxylate symporter